MESLCHKFNFEGPGLRILQLMIASPNSEGFNSRVPGLRVPLRFRVSGPMVSGLRVPDLRILGLRSQGPGSQGPRSQVPWSRSQGPRSRISGPDFRLCQIFFVVE